MYNEAFAFAIPSIGIAFCLGFVLVPFTMRFRRARAVPKLSRFVHTERQPVHFEVTRYRNSAWVCARKHAPALLAAISALMLGAVAQAAGDTHFVLAAYSNVAGGQEILSGDYKAALTALDTASDVGGFNAAQFSQNLCVALTMAHQWPAAQTACDRAVRYAQLAKVTNTAGSLGALHQQDETIAIAYSDRAVLEWLTANAKAATQDMEHAKSLLPHSVLVAQNVTALGARSTVTDVRSAEER